MEKIYDPKQVEEKLYKEWEENGYFTAVIDKHKEPYTIVIPPPNVTGQLHMGHALNNTLQDILIRWKRMQGYCTLWLPGTDHASISTEAKVVAKLKTEGKTKYEIGREKYLEEAWAWTHKYGGTIINQLKKLGCSCDWSRTRFTLDEGLSKAVLESFIRYYEKGLIYRGERIINWCPKCNTTISDIEIVYHERASHLWNIMYPIKDSNEYIIVATTRPETMLGDTAVAVHPNDERYKHLVGKMAVLPLMNREIPIIADEYVEKEFGTGVVKITPAHDPNDFEVGLRHNLPQIRVTNDDGTMNQNAGQYEGLSREDAREQIVKDLANLKLMAKIEDYTHNVGACERCGTTVDPVISKQWFVKMKPLAEPAIEVVKNETIKFLPERLEKVYFNWMENIQDWCISRQLWWGHRIPAYYCLNCEEVMVSREEVIKCSKCGSSNIKHDEDTLDTWFSSALWPFSTLGWPDKTEDLEYFYPTNVLITASDIIFFWVARMIFSSMEFMKEAPFKHVIFNALVRDAQGRKMSKSLGNGIDPLDVIDKYGTDALRFMLAMNNSPGNDIRFQWEKVEACRNFANKIWNAARFIEMNLEINENKLPDFNKLTTADKWILSRYNKVIKEVTDNLEKFEIGMAAQKLYDFVWDEFCDWYIELSKTVLYDKETDSQNTQLTLVYVLSNTLKLLHPFMPFITESIWRALPHEGNSIMVSEWPKYLKELEFSSEEAKMQMLMETIKSIRNIRAEMNVPASKRIKAIIVTIQHEQSFVEGTAYIEKLAGVSQVIIQNSKQGIGENAVSIVTPYAEVFLPLDNLVDKEKELERLAKEKAHLDSEIERIDNKLANQGFVSKAPKEVVDAELEKKKNYEEMLAKVLERMNLFK